MRTTLRFQDESIDLDLPESALLGEWHGPAGSESSAIGALVTDAIESPVDFPPLRSAVVPGDRVTIALGAGLPDAAAILRPIVDALASAEVTPADILVLTPPAATPDEPQLAGLGVQLRYHDPSDRKQIAYLASTKEGRRIYLDRDLTEADIVVPIGLLGHDPVLSYSGPWSAIFPGLSDEATIQSFRTRRNGVPSAQPHHSTALEESSEVSWLLGCQFQVGVVAGTTGIVKAIAGRKETVLEEGRRLVDEVWSYRPQEHAELAIVGIGRPGTETGIDDVVRGLAAATHLVHRGGKIVVLSRARGPIGSGVRRLLNAGDPARIAAAIRKHESDPDHATAVSLAESLAWADVYLLSGFDSSDVDDLGMIPLDRPIEAQRLAALCGSCHVVSDADLVRAEVMGESAGDRS